MVVGELNKDLVMWVATNDEETVKHYVDAMANAILVNYQLTSFNRAGYEMGNSGEEF